MRDFRLTYPGNLLIDRDLHESAVQQLDKTLAIEIQDMHTGWVWYKLPPFWDEGMKFDLRLAFVDGLLREVSLIHDDETLYGRGWEDCSKEKEILRAQNTAAWFNRKGFKLGTFSWGTIWASYDPRSGCGSGGVRFSGSER